MQYIAESHPEREAGARDQVHYRRVLRYPQRMMHRQKQNVRTDPHGLRARRYSGRHHQSRRQIAIIYEVVLREPHVGEIEALTFLDLLSALGVEVSVRLRERRLLPEVVPQAEGWGAVFHRHNLSRSVHSPLSYNAFSGEIVY